VADSPGKAKALAAAGTLVIGSLGLLEGTRLLAYHDAVGILTDCSGNTHHVVAGQVHTPEECRVIDQRNADAALDDVWDALDEPSKLPPATLAAFALFQFNTGGFKNSTAKRLVNAGDVVEGCKDLYRWVYAGKPPRRLQGLWNRRDYEVKLCLRDLP
jgi:GH24 family phage-related lysozyme (muramidase)